MRAEIENAAVSGLRLSGTDVARVSRDKRRVTLRHAWPEGSTDGRVWAAVKSAAWDLACEVADRHGHIVDVVSSRGDLLDQIYPERGLA